MPVVGEDGFEKGGFLLEDHRREHFGGRCPLHYFHNQTEITPFQLERYEGGEEEEGVQGSSDWDPIGA
jgi:hypothetical protein